MVKSQRYLGPSWKLSKTESSHNEITSKQAKEDVRKQVLCEYASLDECFYMPMEDLDFMLYVLDPNYTPIVFYEMAQAFPREYEEYINDERYLDWMTQ